MTSNTSIFKASTTYSNLSIRHEDSLLKLYSEDALQSSINPDNPHRLELKNLATLMSVLLFIPKPERVLVLGTGGGSLIHFFKYYYPECVITSVEIDAELLTIMHEHMLLPTADEQLTYVIDDAEHYLQHCNQSFDLIISDLFINNQSPQWLLKPGSMQSIYRRLSDHGAIAYNLMITGNHEFSQYYRDLRQVFSSRCLCLLVPDLENTLAIAFRYQAPKRDMAWYMEQALQLGQQHEINYMEILSSIYTTNPSGSGII